MAFNYNININNSKKQYGDIEKQKDRMDFIVTDYDESLNVFEQDDGYQDNGNLEAVMNLFEEYDAEYDNDFDSGVITFDDLKEVFDEENEKVLASLNSASDIVETEDLKQNLSLINFKGDMDEAMAKLDAVKSALSARLDANEYGSGAATTYAPNGKFDMPSIQGEVGDCWLLSATNSLLSTEKGKEILDNSITVNDEKQTVTVNLAGVKKSYEIPISELNNNIENAAGDMDMRALEVAIEKYGIEEGIATNIFYSNGDVEFDESYDLDSNFSRTAFNLLVPKEERHTETTYNYEGEINKKFDEIMNNKGNTAACISLMEEEDEFSVKKSAISGSFFGRYKQDKKEARSFMRDLTDNNRTIYSHHAYSIVDVTQDDVYLVNPWYTDEKIKVPRKKIESLEFIRLETQTFKD